MAQTIEEFLVSLKFGIDQSSHQRFFDTVQRITGQFTKLGAEIVGSTAAITAFAEKMADAGNRLFYSSQRLGESAANLQSFALAMTTLGMSSAAAMQQLERFGLWMRSYGPAGTGFLRQQLGVTATDPQQAMQQAMMTLYNRGMRPGMQGSPAYAMQMQYANMLGLDETAILNAPLLARRQQAMADVANKVWGGRPEDAQRGLGLFTHQSNEMMVQFARLQSLFTNIAEKMALTIYPAVSKFIDQIIASGPQLVAIFDKIAAGLAAFVDFVGRSIELMHQLPDAVKTMAEVFLGASYGLKILSSPLGLVIAGFTALLLLMDDYRGWQEDQKDKKPHRMHSLFDWGEGSFFGTVAGMAKDLGQFGKDDPWLVGIVGGLGALAFAFTSWGNSVTLAANALRLLVGTPVGWLAMMAAGLAVGNYFLGKEAEKQTKNMTPEEKRLYERNLGPLGPHFMPTVPGLLPGTLPQGGPGPGPALQWLWQHIFGGGGTTDPNKAGPAPYNTGSLIGPGGRYQLASLGDNWMPPSAFANDADRPGNTDLFHMLVDSAGKIIDTLGDIGDTLTDIAMAAGAPFTARSSGGSGAGAGGGGGAGDANFNPMNLSALPGEAHSGRWRVFANWTEGVTANVRQLLRYQSTYGLHTLRGIISKWAPAFENDTTGYIDKVARSLGIGADQPINLASNPELLERLVHAMTRIEIGHDISQADVHAGVGAALGLKVPPTAAGGGNRTNNFSPNIVVHGASDPHRTAQAVGAEVRRQYEDYARYGRTAFA
jgi:hypothetical protein